MASKYSAIWKQLKLASTVSVAMHPAYHKNLIRMMAVEKDRDIGYKIALGTAGHKVIMTSCIEQSKVTFTLTKYHLNGVPVINLGDL